MREYMLKRYHERMNYARSYLGGECCNCGITEEDCDLNLHHVNSEEKSFTIAHLWSVNLKRFLEEVEKCILLCEECHHEEHRSKAPHGTPQKYWSGCKCRDCKNANNKHNAEYKKRTNRN